MIAMLRSLLSVRRHHGGVAAVEFALMAPILLACLAGVYDLGSALQQQIHLQQAVRAGGLYAMSYSGDPAFATSLTSVIQAAVPDWGTGITVSAPTSSCLCLDLTTSSTTTNSTCTACTVAGQALQRFVTVQASRPFSAVFYRAFSTNLSASYVALTY